MRLPSIPIPDIAKRGHENLPGILTDELRLRCALSGRCLVGVLLMLVSPAALAQKIPLWVVVGVVSPVLGLLMVGTLALAAPGLGKAGLHFRLLVLWVVAFLLTSYYVENDWVIWTPMHLYILHLALLPILVFRQLLRRIETSAVAPSRTLLLGFLSFLLSASTTIFVTSLSILPWQYFGKLTGIDTMGAEVPELWCFLATWIVLQSAMLAVWQIHRNDGTAQKVN